MAKYTGYSFLRAIVAFLLAVVLGFSLFSDVRHFALAVLLIAFVLYILLDPERLNAVKYPFISARNTPNWTTAKVTFTCFLVVLLGSTIYWLAYFPGGFNLDSYGQWDQAHGLMHLNNWHPVITTLFYRVLVAFHDSLAFCIAFQIFVFALVSSILIGCLYARGLPAWACCAVAVVTAFSPAIQMNNVCLIKDVPFCIAIILNVITMMRIIETGGVWLNSGWHCLMLALNSLLILLIRYNGMFFVLPELALLCFVYKQYIKRALSVIVLTLLGVILFQGPVLHVLDVQPHSNTVGEISGIPMAVMAEGLLSKTGEVLPPDVEKFLLEIAPLDEWSEHYISGEWDSCKWEFGGIDLLSDTKFPQIIDMAWRTMRTCPQAAYCSIRENTRIVWQFVGYQDWEPWVYIEENDYGIYAQPVPITQSIVDGLEAICRIEPLCSVTWNLGLQIMISLLAGTLASYKRLYRQFVLLLPPLSYNICTMLLLSGPNQRYFYFNWVITVPILLFLAIEEDSTQCACGSNQSTCTTGKKSASLPDHSHTGVQK